MLKIEKTEVVGWEAAIRGMRNPLNSWDKSDSHYECLEYNKLSDDHQKVYLVDQYIPGLNDLTLMMDLRAAGIDHRKFMRMLIVSADITAPLYWWKEYDTYKVGTVANSCSTMHKIAAKEFELDDFSTEHILSLSDNEFKFPIICGVAMTSMGVFSYILDALNFYRKKYLETKDKTYWWQMIQLLPSSYNQKRTIMLNYEVLANIYKSRKNHKLDEWHTFCDWIESLPYSKLITGGADYLNKKLRIPASDEIIADTLRKLKNMDAASPDKSKAILLEFYEKMKDASSGLKTDFKIVDEWNQYGHVNCVESKALRDHFDKLAEEGKR